MKTWQQTAAALIASMVVVGCGASSAPTTQPTTSQSPHPSVSTSAPTSPTAPSNGPSQSTADAKRDGVVPALAAIPFADRVGIIRSAATPEGVWALSRPPASAKKYAKGCRLGPDTGKYPTDTICTTEYGEVLLLDAARTRIIRAYPLPSVPPIYLIVTPDAVWCGRPGDTTLSETTLPDTMLCRIDRRTLQMRVHVFAPGEESECLQPCFFPPRGWTVTNGRIAMTALQVDATGVWAKDAKGTWTHLDPKTLAIVARSVHRS